MGIEQMIDDAIQFSSTMEHLIADPKIIVVGCGGGGNNSLNRLGRIGLSGAETIAINTDQVHLNEIHADKKLLIGRRTTKGRGAGGHPEVGEYCAEEAEDEIRALLQGADITFITAGMGGGTGTGSAPVVARIAKEMGSVVIGMVTTPFDAERGRKKRAMGGIQKLKQHTDSTIILDNNRLMTMVPSLPIHQAFSVMDQLISEVIKGISDSITEPSLINLDFADLRTVMTHGGASTILYAENSANDPEAVVAEALSNPLLDVDLSGATSTFIHITSGPDLTVKQTNTIIDGMTEFMGPEANVIFGTRIDEEYHGSIKIMSVVNGVQFNDPYMSMEMPPTEMMGAVQVIG